MAQWNCRLVERNGDKVSMPWLSIEAYDAENAAEKYCHSAEVWDCTSWSQGDEKKMTDQQREWDAEDIAELRRMIPDLDAVTTQNPVTQVYFRAGLLACREVMARFVEQGGNPEIAASIRANWWPSLGDDPGVPRRYTFDELVEELPEGKFKSKDISPSVEALARAWVFVEHQGREPAKEAA